MALMSAREALAKRQKEVYICRPCLIFPSGRVKNCAASVKVRPVPVPSGKAGCSKPGPADCDEVLS